MKKSVKEALSVLTGAKMASSNPKNHGPLLPIRPATQKTNYGHGEVKKTTKVVKGKMSSTFHCVGDPPNVNEGWLGGTENVNA